MIPTWRMKFTPLLRFSRSFSGVSPSRIEGVSRSSASVKSHCVSATMRISLGRAGLWSDWELSVAEGIVVSDMEGSRS